MKMDIDKLINSLDNIKSEIQKIYNTNPLIHINGAVTNPNMVFNNKPVIINAVYPHAFQIEEVGSRPPMIHVIQYADVLLHHIDIVEIESKR